MNDLSTRLATILADGKTHFVADLCQQLAVDVGVLNHLRGTLPEYIASRLKQLDDCWQLREPVVYFTQSQLADWAAEENIDITVLSECTSSNSVLFDRIRHQPDNIQPALLITHRQTAGRGRMAKKWESEEGQALTFSLSWYSPQPQTALSALPLLTALSCQQALQTCGVSVQIKWPNDLLIDNAKVGGILIESTPHPLGTWCVIGIGLNIHQPTTNTDAAGVYQADADWSIETLLRSIVHRLLTNLQQFALHGFSAFQAAYTAAHREHGQTVQLLHQSALLAEGTVQGVDQNGALLLLHNNEVRRFVCGEISLRHPPAKHDSNTLLLLDCGNSQVKWALVTDGEIIETFRTPYNKLHHLANYYRQHAYIQRIYGSAVCGETKKEWVSRQLPKKVAWLASERSACGIRNHYRQPSEHGADRWFNALGARRFSQNACVIVSCGTAITIDALTHDNQYLGGSIMPGFNLMKEAMSDNTANLDRPFGRPYPFATTTSNALASGVLDASVGAILLMHSRLKAREVDKPTDLIFTGGGALRLHRHFPEQFLLDTHSEIVDNLVIYGLLNWIAHT